MGVNECVYGCQVWRRVRQPDFRKARFVQMGTYNGAAFVSGSDDGRGFGSVFHQYFPLLQRKRQLRTPKLSRYADRH
jgi:hypothetical protein